MQVEGTSILQHKGQLRGKENTEALWLPCVCGSGGQILENEKTWRDVIMKGSLAFLPGSFGDAGIQRERD